ncbi:MAG: hypothetical protein KME30_17880 [Iphinoe sp. HA4291-MV1]|nr:hypothetical protein [Iphinoe sp. HA4291-MV1]
MKRKRKAGAAANAKRVRWLTCSDRRRTQQSQNSAIASLRDAARTLCDRYIRNDRYEFLILADES